MSVYKNQPVTHIQACKHYKFNLAKEVESKCSYPLIYCMFYSCFTTHYVDSSYSENLSYALRNSSRLGRDSEVLYYLRNGINPDGHYWHPLHWACINNNFRCAELNIKWGADLQRKRIFGDGSTP